MNTRNSKKTVDKACVWSQAGVIKDMTCEKNYDCDHCDTEKSIQKKVSPADVKTGQERKNEGATKTTPHWKEILRDRPNSQRPCIHHMKGQIEFRSCTNEYYCANCDFNQYFLDQYAVHAVINPVDALDMEGFKIPQGYYFHSGHTWVKIESNSEARIGFDDFTYRLLGRADSVIVPLVGKQIKQGEKKICFNKGERQAFLTVPLSGIVTAVNMDLRENGTQGVESPYTDGWIMRIHTDNLRNELKYLLIGQEEKRNLKDNLTRLHQFIASKGQPLAADGGDLVEDLIGVMPDLGWDQLINSFFK